MRSGIVVLLLVMTISAQDKPGAGKSSPPPKVLFAQPMIAVAGAKTKLILRGRNLDGITEIRVHEPKSRGALIGPPKKVAVPNNYPVDRIGDSEVEVELDIAGDAPGGHLTLSVVGPGGNSNTARVALVDELRTAVEKEPNDSFEKAQVVQLPCDLNARIDRERDVDVYQFKGRAGDELVIEAIAAKYGSPADLMLTLFDGERKIVDLCDDIRGATDPELRVKLPYDGTFYISVIESNDLGGSMFPYRLVVRIP